MSQINHNPSSKTEAHPPQQAAQYSTGHAEHSTYKAEAEDKKREELACLHILQSYHMRRSPKQPQIKATMEICWDPKKPHMHATPTPENHTCMQRPRPRLKTTCTHVVACAACTQRPRLRLPHEAACSGRAQVAQTTNHSKKAENRISTWRVASDTPTPREIACFHTPQRHKSVCGMLWVRRRIHVSHSHLP